MYYYFDAMTHQTVVPAMLRPWLVAASGARFIDGEQHEWSSQTLFVGWASNMPSEPGNSSLLQKTPAPTADLTTPRPFNLAAPTIRNLIYHVCPLASNDTWRANVRQLLRRWDVFNGRRVVAIAFGAGLLPPAAVREAFAGHACEFLELPNDRDLREVATFLPLLISVANQDERQATFYAHTKGNSTEGSALGAMYWRNEMYHRLLDHWQECMAALENAAAVGIHKIRWPDNSPSIYPTRLECGKWMFAGTFFWFRHDLVFGHHCWRRLSIDRYGAEAWLAGLFGPEQVKSVYQLWPEERFPTPSPYDPTIYPNPIRD